MEWKTIESAPRDGTDVLLFFPGYKRKVWLGAYDIRETFIHGKLDYRSEGWNIGAMLPRFGEKPAPTHWMPLPEGPSAADDENLSPAVIAYLAMQAAGTPAQPGHEAQATDRPT